MLSIAQELEVRLRLRIDADAARQRVAVEGAACTLLAEVARHGRGQFLDCYRGAPEPETRRDRREVRRNEQISLQSFDRTRSASKREHHVGENVERKTPEHALRERRQIESDQCLRAQQRYSPRPV